MKIKNIIVLFLIMWGTSAKSELKNMETAVFGGGCFWCVEAIYQEINGVVKVESGYMGGQIANPTYREVCSGKTGHAEVIKIQFDPNKVSYVQLLEVFFKTHDPTTLNRQGADVGTQYRSVVYYYNERQKEEAVQVVTKINSSGIYSDKIVTEISPAVTFFVAEAYHQNYYSSNSSQPYCRAVITPKIEKFNRLFKELKK